MKIKEDDAGNTWLKLSQSEIIEAVWKYWNFPKGSKVQIILAPRKEEQMAAIVVVP
jgi:hypothetical protein